MEASVHIASLVVHGKPAGIRAIADAIGRLEGAEVHGASDTGKLVVTLETEDESAILARIDAINQLDGVYSVSMVFHQVEDEEAEQ